MPMLSHCTSIHHQDLWRQLPHLCLRLPSVLADTGRAPLPTNKGGRYQTRTAVPENVLWGYICQIANAREAIQQCESGGAGA